jgi:hypothetical protein
VTTQPRACVVCGLPWATWQRCYRPDCPDGRDGESAWPLLDPAVQAPRPRLPLWVRVLNVLVLMWLIVWFMIR